MRVTVLIFACVLTALMPARAWCADGDPNPKPNRQSKTDDKPAEPNDSATVAGAGPKQIGDADPSFWGTLSADQQSRAMVLLKAFGDKASIDLKHPLRSRDSKCFLLYYDVSEADAVKYLALLDKMHGKLTEMFGIEKASNVFRGKALVFVFAKIQDYHLFERICENTDPGDSYGMTHCFGDGLVHMAFFRYPSDSQFKHLLVHETVHGFIHRYKTPANIPSWVNEGLADDLATELVPNGERNKQTKDLVYKGLKDHNAALGDFFAARQIDGWEYPIAETLCAWMIKHNSRGYLDFINGIKDGQKWEDSLKKNYAMTPNQLLAEYARAMRIKSIRQ
jgi:hypothetical protein